MENRYPLFAGGRILKKEALWDLRDYAYESWQLYYADYTDGVIRGCRIRVEGTNLVIGKGIIKCGNFIYLLKEEAEVPFTAENKLVALKAEFEEKAGSPDYLAYDVKFFLDDVVERKKNQIELCRFHLRTGSVLRDTYKNFYDMRTEYDTVNLLHATVAGRGGERIHPAVLLRFAEEMQICGRKEEADRAFCYELLSSEGEVETMLVMAYLEDKGVDAKSQYQNRESIVRELMDILNSGSTKPYCGEKKKVIYVE